MKAITSICLILGVLGLLSVGAAQSNLRPYDVVLSEYEARMDALVDQYNATLPHQGPLTPYQSELLAELMGPKPQGILGSGADRIVGAIRSGVRRGDAAYAAMT